MFIPAQEQFLTKFYCLCDRDSIHHAHCPLLKKMDDSHQIVISSMQGDPFLKKMDSTQFVILKSNQLVSRAEIIELDLSISDCPYKIAGVLGVLTVPQFRNQGYGKYLLKTVTAHIVNSHADIGMLFCKPELSQFYTTNGWIICKDAVTRIGTVENYNPYTMQRLMIFVSEKAKTEQSSLAHQLIYLDSAW